MGMIKNFKCRAVSLTFDFCIVDMPEEIPDQQGAFPGLRRVTDDEDIRRCWLVMEKRLEMKFHVFQFRVFFPKQQKSIVRLLVPVCTRFFRVMLSGTFLISSRI